MKITNPSFRLRSLFALFVVSLTYIGCGKDGPTAPTTVIQPPVVSFTTATDTITAGQTATLKVVVTNATKPITIDQGVGTVAASGSVDVKPTVTTTYTITASNGDTPDRVTTKPLTIKVNPAPAATGGSTPTVPGTPTGPTAPVGQSHDPVFSVQGPPNYIVAWKDPETKRIPIDIQVWIIKITDAGDYGFTLEACVHHTSLPGGDATNDEERCSPSFLGGDKLRYGPHESGSFTFTFDPKMFVCGRAQPDVQALINDHPSDRRTFVGVVVDYLIVCPTPTTQLDSSASLTGGCDPSTGVIGFSAVFKNVQSLTLNTVPPQVFTPTSLSQTITDTKEATYHWTAVAVTNGVFKTGGDQGDIHVDACKKTPPQTLTCAVSPPNPTVGQTVTATANGGNGTSYLWSVLTGSPSSWLTAIFPTSFATAGTKVFTVTSGALTATCSVVIQAQPQCINGVNVFGKALEIKGRVAYYTVTAQQSAVGAPAYPVMYRIPVTSGGPDIPYPQYKTGDGTITLIFGDNTFAIPIPNYDPVTAPFFQPDCGCKPWPDPLNNNYNDSDVILGWIFRNMPGDIFDHMPLGATSMMKAMRWRNLRTGK